MRKIIGLVGVKGSGKTTAANAIKSAVGNDIKCVELAFADKLKKTLADIFDKDINTFYDPRLKEQLLEDPIYLDQYNLLDIIREFNLEYVYDYYKHGRKFNGTIIDTPRQLMTTIGTDFLHPIDADVHIKATFAEMPASGLVIFSDIRFVKEFEALVREFEDSFYPYYIQNNRAEAVCGDHPSEKGVFDISGRCMVIANNGNQSEFEAEIIKETKEYVLC